MNTPKPGPPSVVELKQKTKPSTVSRKIRYTANFNDGASIDVFATDEASALEIAFEMRSVIPLSVKKAPFVPTEHLQQRPFRDSSELKELRKKLTKENNRG